MMYWATELDWNLIFGEFLKMCCNFQNLFFTIFWVKKSKIKFFSIFFYRKKIPLLGLSNEPSGDGNGFKLDFWRHFEMWEGSKKQPVYSESSWKMEHVLFLQHPLNRCSFWENCMWSFACVLQRKHLFQIPDSIESCLLMRK